MCGIAGLVHLDGAPVSPAVLQRMTDSLAHRGPDGEGQWIEGNVGLGHRRLAIIDLSPAGHQPMVSADHRFVLTYNGEIYNFRELRAELEAEGYWFRSKCDSEVLLNALAACLRPLGPQGTQTAPCARSVRHQAALYCPLGPKLRVRFRAQGDRNDPGVRDPAGPEGAFRIFHVPEHLYRPHIDRERGAAPPWPLRDDRSCFVRTGDEAGSVLGFRFS